MVGVDTGSIKTEHRFVHDIHVSGNNKTWFVHVGFFSGRHWIVALMWVCI